MSFWGRMLLIYFFLMNFITFILRGMDKWKAVRETWRIREKTLLLFCAGGGFLGALLAMGVFHHKTIKTKFLVRFYLIMVLWIAILTTCYVFLP